MTAYWPPYCLRWWCPEVRRRSGDCSAVASRPSLIRRCWTFQYGTPTGSLDCSRCRLYSSGDSEPSATRKRKWNDSTVPRWATTSQQWRTSDRLGRPLATRCAMKWWLAGCSCGTREVCLRPRPRRRRHRLPRWSRRPATGWIACFSEYSRQSTGAGLDSAARRRVHKYIRPSPVRLLWTGDCPPLMKYIRVYLLGRVPAVDPSLPVTAASRMIQSWANAASSRRRTL